MGIRVDGMRVTGEHGVAVEGRYSNELHGRALPRRDLDWVLLRDAIAAGVQFEPGVTCRRAIVVQSGAVNGVVVDGAGREHRLAARVTIAADGGRSRLAFGLGLTRHARSPRRWAIGAYYEGALGLSSLGEMHVRRGRYLGVAPLPGRIANVCLVTPWHVGDPPFDDPAAMLRSELSRDPFLRDRFMDARLVRHPIVLGPLAVEYVGRSMDGLLVAGDAAGFIDPMTGDGLRFAIRGGELAAHAALEAIEHGWKNVNERLSAARVGEFACKWRFNRALRTLVASPLAVQAAGLGAVLAPFVVRTMIAYAGDCPIALMGRLPPATPSGVSRAGIGVGAPTRMGE
jgi:flavin-dependent dehydrogenase